MTPDVERIADGFFLTEGPRLDDEGCLYFGDVTGHGLYRCPPGGDVEAVDTGRMSVGGVVFDDAGHVLCSGRKGIERIDPRSGARDTVRCVVDGVQVINANELEADPSGNLYGGTLDYEAFERGVTPKMSMVFRLNRDGTATKLLDLVVPNGMDFSPSGDRFYLSESGDGVFSYGVAATGDLTDRRRIATMPDSDGIVVDSAGGCWVARYLCNQLEYYDAQGNLAHSLTMPFGAVASVTMGGPDLRDLYVAGGDLRERGKGGIVRLRAEIPGLPARKTAVFA